MKYCLTLLLLPFIQFVFAQSGTVTIPSGTTISMELMKEVFEGKDREGSSVQFRVSADVVIDGVVVISAKTPVRCQVTTSKNRELRVDIYDVKAVDGTVVPLSDCWIFTTAAQNQKSHGAALWAGTRKNCSTASKVEVKPNSAKF